MKGRLGEDVLLATGVGGAIDVATGAAPYLLTVPQVASPFLFPLYSACVSPILHLGH